jgi:hypothetical protein
LSVQFQDGEDGFSCTSLLLISNGRGKAIRPRFKLNHAIHSVHRDVTVSKFGLQVRPCRVATFSVPNLEYANDRLGHRIVTDHPEIFLLRMGNDFGKHLVEYPDEVWPGHLFPTRRPEFISSLGAVEGVVKSKYPTDCFVLAIAHTMQVRQQLITGHLPPKKEDTTLEQMGKLSSKLMVSGISFAVESLI